MASDKIKNLLDYVVRNIYGAAINAIKTKHPQNQTDI